MAAPRASRLVSEHHRDTIATAARRNGDGQACDVSRGRGWDRVSRRWDTQLPSACTITDGDAPKGRFDREATQYREYEPFPA